MRTACLLTIALGLAAGAAAAQTVIENPRTRDAATICAATLAERYGAGELGETTVRTSNNREWVHTEAEVPGQGTVRFRCQVYYGQVRSLDYLVRETGLGEDDTEWVTAPDAFEPPEEEDAEADTETEGANAQADGDGTGDGAVSRSYRVGWGEGYAPEGAEGITCYSKRGACYGADGKLDLGWTSREFPSN